MEDYLFHSDSEAETEGIGRMLADRLEPGMVLALFGDLGAGKTAFVRGLAVGLGIEERVTSPTYTIVNEYGGGRCPLFHFDLYRLNGPEDLQGIGWDDYLARDGICAVEWSERAEDLLEPSCVRVYIRKGSGEHTREIFAEGVPDDGPSVL